MKHKVILTFLGFWDSFCREEEIRMKTRKTSPWEGKQLRKIPQLAKVQLRKTSLLAGVQLRKTSL